MRFAILIVSILFALHTTSACFGDEQSVWIGMSAPTNGQKEGIYRTTLDTKTGALTAPELAAEIGAPEFLAIHPNGKRLYAACKLADGKPGVASYEISEDKHSLKLINSEPTGDGGACHLAVDHSGRLLFTAQYGTGTVAVFPLASDGKILPRSELVKHEGTGPNKQRQEAPHPHWVGADPSNRFLLVPDLGSDRIVIYEIDFETGKLVPHGFGSCPPGSGPRHLVFHPNGKFAYVVNELQISVTVFEYDKKAGTLKPIQTVESLPEDLRENACSGAEICVHPEGTSLYASTRGHDSVSVFRIDPETGKLTFAEREAIRGSHPRSVNLDPKGNWLLAAGRDSNTISAFQIDPKTGGLVYSGKIVNSPAPICVEFQPVE
jgi:6-phosphogluconolactonase